MNTKLKILAINNAETQFSSHYSGYIGIAPYSLEKTSESDLAKYKDDPNLNFMYQLKARKNIKHMVVAFFTSSDKSIKTSSVKFGGWDENALADGEKLTMIRTINAKSWALRLKYVTIDYNHVQL